MKNVFCTLDDVLQYEQPQPYIVKNDEYSDDFKIPVLTAGKSFIIGKTNENFGIYDKLPVIIFDDFTTASQFVNFKFKVKSSAMKILSVRHHSLDIKFFYYLMKTINCPHDTHKRYWISDYSQKEISLPPLAEQGRIVAKIEELFAGIDAGVENLKSVKNQIALYRQSVLKSAFLKVTAWEKLSNICLVIKVGPFGTMLHEADYISNGIPLVNPSQIKNSKILPKQDKCISPQKAEELKEYRLMQGDIVLGRRGEMGRCATVDEMEVGWLCGTGSILIRLKKQMNAPFYNFFLASPLNVRYLEDNATGTTMKNLNEKIVANIPVPVPTLAEQERIVAEIESRFERADALETAVDRALNDAEKLKQAVLKKAFSGELVPQNPDDEPASVLLDRIRAARASELPAKKGKRK